MVLQITERNVLLRFDLFLGACINLFFFQPLFSTLFIIVRPGQCHGGAAREFAAVMVQIVDGFNIALEMSLMTLDCDLGAVIVRIFRLGEFFFGSDRNLGGGGGFFFFLEKKNEELIWQIGLVFVFKKQFFVFFFL